MLIKLPSKIGLIIKVAIVFIALLYILSRFILMDGGNLSFPTFLIALRVHPFLFYGTILLMPLNWFLESLKWKNAAGRAIDISLSNALMGVLAGVTIGLATPNRIGEFVGRVFMVKGGDRIQLLLLSSVPSFAQVLVTIMLGLIGFVLHPELAGLATIDLILLFAGVFLVFSLPFIFRFIPYKWLKNIVVLRLFPRRLFARILLLSFLRYAVYVFQFCLILSFYGIVLNLELALVCIVISYFIVTIIPTFSFTEVFIRGGIAGIVFSNAGVTFNLAFAAAVTLWIINVAIPALIGTVFVFKLKFYANEE